MAKFHAGLVAPAALIGALAALGGALWLGRGDGAFSRESVILAGIAVAAFLGALVALVKALNEESVTSIVFWIMISGRLLRVPARYFLSIAVMLRSGHVLAQVAAARFTRIAPCWRLGYDFAHRKFAWGAILREASFCGHEL